VSGYQAITLNLRPVVNVERNERASNYSNGSGSEVIHRGGNLAGMIGAVVVIAADGIEIGVPGEGGLCGARR
jgi:hypothetical protein